MRAGLSTEQFEVITNGTDVITPRDEPRFSHPAGLVWIAVEDGNPLFTLDDYGS
jgi:hypothetical protein